MGELYINKELIYDGPFDRAMVEQFAEDYKPRFVIAEKKTHDLNDGVKVYVCDRVEEGE